MLFSIMLFAALGAFAGFMSGLIGIGGGTIVVPALVLCFHYLQLPPQELMHLATGTSLAVMMFTSISSARAHHHYHNIVWPILIRMLPGIMMGTIGGAVLAYFLPAKVLKFFFALFLLVIAAQMLMSKKEKLASLRFPGKKILFLVTSFIGLLAGLLGVGGGALLIPFFLRCHLKTRKAMGTSAACALPVAIVGTLSVIATGLVAGNLPHYSLGYVYWPAALGISITSVLFAPWGAKLAKQLSGHFLKKIFAAFLLITSIEMILK